ncbi:hypothetical protein A9Q99_04340 [Gammaproteobacteria bacterium 45_16_T64]|nr:hypothetical protein A9Q99_04340 [Gammaproteobacteria bacterium 45_16_T64]
MKLSKLFRWRKKQPAKTKTVPKPTPASSARKTASTKPASAQQSLQIIKPINVKLNIGHYRLEPFTEGGVCVVMKGIPKEPGKPKLAVKLVREQWLNHAAVRRQFSNESQIVKELHHPYLPKYLSRGLIDGKAYYAYEFIEGVPLINLSQEKDRFPPELIKDIATNIVTQLLEQLVHVQERLKPVAHGDISSENILIDSKQRIYLVDFGCSHFVKQAHKDSYQWLAKPSFISPEQAKGEIWDHRSDLYQAGILFYELVKNRRWNEGKSKREKVLFAASKERPHEDFLSDIVGRDISSIIAKLLDPNPATRHQNAKEALMDLNAIG